MSRLLLENLLEAIARVLQAPLQGSGTNVGVSRAMSCIFGRLPSESPLDGSADTLGKRLLAFMLFQLFIQLRREHGQQLGIAGNKGTVAVGRSEDDRISSGPEDDGAAEVALNGLRIRARTHKFEAQWRHAGSGTVPRDSKDVSETDVGEDFRLDAVGGSHPNECSTRRRRISWRALPPDK